MIEELWFWVFLLIALVAATNEMSKHEKYGLQAAANSRSAGSANPDSTVPRGSGLPYQMLNYNYHLARPHRQLGIEDYWRRRMSYERAFQHPRLEPQNNEDPRILVESWRKSIVGLVTLADRNFESAKAFYEQGHCAKAILTSSTGVENISRALIHCCGGKPDESPGQEEALRMLSTRFEGDKRTRFERAIRNVECINENTATLGSLSTDQVTNQIIEQAKARQVLELATETISILREIITEKYANEIPGLYSRIEAHSMV